MSGPPMILSLLPDSHKHAVNPTKLTTSAYTKGSTFHMSSPKPTWIIDSGVMDHMTFDSGQLISHKLSTQSVVFNTNGTPSTVVGEGSQFLSNSIHLDYVLIVPSLNQNLLSVAQLTTTLGCTVTFWPNHCVFKDILTGKTIGCGTRQGKLYNFDWAPDIETKVGQAFTTSGASFERQRDKLPCDTCELTMSHRVPFSLSTNKSLVPFSLIHSDVWGFAQIATPAGARWFVTFIDDCTRMTWVFLMKTKGEVNLKFQ
ncbi:unnamed protein product [Prunus armeniaca]